MRNEFETSVYSKRLVEENMETRVQLSELLANDIDTERFVKVLHSCRRLGLMYAEKEPTSIRPEMFVEELSYMKDGINIGMNEVKDSIATVYRMQLAFEPIINFYTESVWGKYSYLDGKISKEDFADFARKYVLNILSWKLNTAEMVSAEPSLLSDGIITQVVGRLKYLPPRLGQENPFLTDIDDTAEYLADNSQVSPEDKLIMKQEWLEFWQKVSLFPREERTIVGKLMAGEQVSSSDKQLVFDSGKEVFGFDLSKISGQKNSKTVLKPKLGMVDENGLSVFINLRPGQAFWLINKLSPMKQAVVFCKLKYLEKSSVKMDPRKIASLTMDAKSALQQMRNGTGNIPPFSGNMKLYLDSFISGEKYKNAQNFGWAKSLNAVRVKYDERGYIDKLSPRKRSIAEMAHSGGDINTIAENLGITRATVYTYLHEMTQATTPS